MRHHGPTIGLLGSYGGRNVGDEAILTSILTSIRQGRPDVSTVVFSRAPEHTRTHYEGVEAVGWEAVSREPVSQIVGRLDMLVLGGGGILYDTEARRYLRLARIAQEQNVPVFTYALGVGPLTDRMDCMLARETLTPSTTVTVRDEESRLVLEEAGVRSPIIVTADPAFLLDPEEFGPELLRAEGVPAGVRLVGMSVREPGRAAEHLDVQGYHELLAHVGDFLVHRLDAYVVFVPMERDDIRHSHAVLSHMNAADRCRVLHGTYGPRQILGLVRHLDMVVGMRLHFLIFAALQGVPLLPLPYAGKVFDLAQQLGAPALRGVVREAAGPLLAEVDRVWDERPAHTERINARTPPLRARAAVTAEHLLSQLDLISPRAPAWDQVG
ncbi:polysaccharide pyruvyl transferase family protein [Streptosporangium sp. NBC_01639]|uniref:polysaccharide pyruvyl transferase family protein n=1 Tax=unclassified Streptosporangium TaxID=2632669 RepID=UPI002DDBED1C|nr:polysaccharide pyruvyl transferase family protein [Streptosporangium sp. NBC_01756]WSC85422.1 polysaccharide pyruvyl transferase family protein [Streptosporangium sp. NBC_01756]WTD55920.1 polysaccharide pyruvyl transferase family protein [Streptosporangium sp. NBC_01639]